MNMRTLVSERFSCLSFYQPTLSVAMETEQVIITIQYSTAQESGLERGQKRRENGENEEREREKDQQGGDREEMDERRRRELP